MKKSQAKAFNEKVTTAAWKNKPNYDIVADKDRMIQPDEERDFAKKIKADTTTLPTSHVPMLSRRFCRNSEPKTESWQTDSAYH